VLHESAASAQAGLSSARAAAQTGSPFNVVLLDYQMPEMDGMQFLKALREDQVIAKTPCVVLSSLGDRVAEADHLQVAAWLTKPVRQAQLYTMLASVSGNTPEHEAAVARETEKEISYPHSRVLLVEDNRVNQEVARRLLRTFGINCKLAVNGREALDLVKQEDFDLVLMDCQMPIMDGYEATGAIRAWEKQSNGKHVPIVAMTANAMQGDREACIAAGMDDYLTKPIKRLTLNTALSQWLKSAPLSQTAPNEAVVEGIPQA
jgi:CheY-like chemotaxis protein